MKGKVKTAAKKSIIGLFILMTMLSTMCMTASATHKVKGEPIVIEDAKTMFYMKPKQIKKDTIYFEKMECVVDGVKNGEVYGHVISMPFYEMFFGRLKYKGKLVKRGTKVNEYFLHDLLNDNDTFTSAVYRFVYLKVKNPKYKKGGKEPKWTWVQVQAHPMR